MSDAQAERRARMLAAARGLAERGGYPAVHMREVASAAGVALGTLYRYFPSKEHLLLGIQIEEVEALAAHVVARPPHGTSDAERLKEVITRARRGLDLQPRVHAATIRALVSGEADLAQEVEQVRAATTRAMATAFEVQPPEPDRIEVVDLLYHVWLSTLIAWIGGLRSSEWIEDELGRAIDRLID